MEELDSIQASPGLAWLRTVVISHRRRERKNAIKDSGMSVTDLQYRDQKSTKPLQEERIPDEIFKSVLSSIVNQILSGTATQRCSQ